MDNVPDIDQDLVDLLNEVEASSRPKVPPQQLPKLKAPKQDPKPVEQKVQKQIDTELVKPLPKSVDQIVEAKPAEIVNSDNMLVDDSTVMTNIRDKVITICSNVIDSNLEDRSQIQKTIGMLMEKVEFGKDDGEVGDVFVEQLVNALRTKSEVNETSVKAADTLVKLLSATKRSTNIKTNNTLNINAAELKELLNKANKSNE